MRIEWTAVDHSTGIAELDGQHRELFRRINLLLEALETDGAADAVKNMLGYLERYMGEHFRCEEEHMLRLRCRGCTLNADQHTRFAAECRALALRQRGEGSSPALAGDLRRLLLGWAQAHIRQVDTLLREGPTTRPAPPATRPPGPSFA